MTVLIFLIATAWAQPPPISVHGRIAGDELHTKETSQLFSVKAVPGDKEIQFHVLGKESGKITAEGFQLRGTYIDNDVEKTGRMERINMGVVK